MNSNYENLINDEQQRQQFNQQPLNNNNNIKSDTSSRVIEIPVQHYTSPIISSNSTSLPNTTKSIPSQKFNQQTPFDDNNSFTDSNEFFNRPSLFDDFHSPFDIIDSPLRNRSLFNREKPFGSRFDEFFRPHLGQQQHTAEPFFDRNSNRSPARDTFQQVNHSKQQQQQSQQDRPLNNSSNTNINNKIEHNNNESVPQTRQSPTSSRTESPKRYISQATILTNPPSTGQQSTAATYKIPIHHISTSPQRSQSPNLANLNSDFKHQIPSVGRTDSPVRQQTSPPKIINSEQSNINSFQKQQSPVLKTGTPPPQSQNQTQPSQSTQKQPQFNQEHQAHQQQPSEDSFSKMGNTFSGQQTSNKRNYGPSNLSDTSDFAHPLPNQFQQQQQQQATPVINQNVKTPQEKCEDILNELNNLEKSVNEFNGQKNDKLYLKLDEYLTRCLLKLDEIERNDDKVNQNRKRLINFTNRLLEVLESKIVASTEKQEFNDNPTGATKSSNDANHLTKNEEQSLHNDKGSKQVNYDNCNQEKQNKIDSNQNLSNDSSKISDSMLSNTNNTTQPSSNSQLTT